MAQLFDFKKVTIGPRVLVATVELAPSAPLMTSDDAEATKRVLELLPHLSDHVCLGDAAPTFGEVARDTELGIAALRAFYETTVLVDGADGAELR